MQLILDGFNFFSLPPSQPNLRNILMETQILCPLPDSPPLQFRNVQKTYSSVYIAKFACATVITFMFHIYPQNLMQC